MEGERGTGERVEGERGDRREGGGGERVGWGEGEGGDGGLIQIKNKECKTLLGLNKCWRIDMTFSHSFKGKHVDCNHTLIGLWRSGCLMRRTICPATVTP